MMMVIAATLIVILFMYIFSELYQDNLSDRQSIMLEDYGYNLQQEFRVAASAHDGYYRTFTVPDSLEGYPLSLNLTSRTLLLSCGEARLSYPIPNVNGTIQTGTNTLQKGDGGLCLNC